MVFQRPPVVLESWGEGWRALSWKANSTQCNSHSYLLAAETASAGLHPQNTAEEDSEGWHQALPTTAWLALILHRGFLTGSSGLWSGGATTSHTPVEA